MIPFDPLLPEVIADPYPHYARLRAEQPIHWNERYRTWFVARYDDAVTAFKDPAPDRGPRSRSQVPGSSASGRDADNVASELPESTMVRGVLMKGLVPAIEKVGARLDALVDTLLDAVEESVEGFLDQARLCRLDSDLIHDFAYPLPITVIADMFRTSRPTIASRFQRMLARHRARHGPLLFEQASDGSSFGQLSTYFADLVEERRARPGDRSDEPVPRARRRTASN